jgi:hypothetical protein
MSAKRKNMLNCLFFRIVTGGYPDRPVRIHGCALFFELVSNPAFAAG